MNNRVPPNINGQGLQHAAGPVPTPPGPLPSSAPAHRPSTTLASRPVPTSASVRANPMAPMRKPKRPTASSNPMVQPRPKRPNPAMVQCRPPPPSRTSAPMSMGRGQPPSSSNEAKRLQDLRNMYGGWTQPKPPQCVEYPVVVTKRELKEGVRFHVMRFGAVANKNKSDMGGVDPTDPNSGFVQPITLHRRDPRQVPVGSVRKEHQEKEPVPQTVDEEEAALQEVAKAEREAKRALEQAQIAPAPKDAKQSGQKPVKKNPKEGKVNPVFQRPDASFRKESELHYEESLPWHLEDAEGKKVWVGSYIGPLSETNAALVVQGSTFRMIPIEKFYKFKEKPPFKIPSIEEAERDMNKKFQIGRWEMVEKQKEEANKEMQATRMAFYGPSKIKTESASFKNSSRAEKIDHDELDFSDNEFQDDDEKPTLDNDNDEDFRDAQQKIRRNQLGANLFGRANEQDVDKELKEEEQAEKERKEIGKAVRKMLLRREKETVYATDSDEDPWKSSSEDEDEDADKTAEGATKEEDTNGVSTKQGKGATSPSGKQKQPDALKKGKSLKRPGSPNLSESSANESSRKKNKHGGSSIKASRSTTPLPGIQNSGLRAVSPGTADAAASQTGSPNPSAVATGSSRAAGVQPVTPEELLDAIPQYPDGIGLRALLNKFPPHIALGDNKVAFVRLVKEVAVLGPDKLLRRRS